MEKPLSEENAPVRGMIVAEPHVVELWLIRRISSSFQTPEVYRLMSFKLIKVGVGSRVTQHSTHGNDLALVMKGMG